MEKILNTSFLDNNMLMLVFLCLAVLRIYIEILINTKYESSIVKVMREKAASKTHKMGLYFSVGYLLLMGPEYLML